ncbi:MAG TPA: hypothetical protein VM580_03090 [Labilithrix sp.]|jgi:hypothetical protein|nr:hypothetical protein [Labilithrix sp.]
MSGDTKAQAPELRYEPETGFFCFAYPPGEVKEEYAVALVEGILKLVPAHCAPGEPMFILIDERYSTGVSREARWVLADAVRTKPYPRGFIALYGGSFAFRTFSNLFVKALMLVSGKLITRAEADEAGARAWLTQQKRAHATADGSPLKGSQLR